METPSQQRDARPTVVVTGASGLIGTAVLRLLAYGDEYGIVGVYNNNQPPLRISGVSYLKADLSDERAWRRLPSADVCALIHCAASIPRTTRNEEATEAGQINARIDKLTVSYAKRGSARLVYLSGTSVYGTATDTVCDEGSELNPCGAYVEGKVASEQMILSTDGVTKSFILRVSAPYGPYQRGTAVVTTFVNRALEGAPLTYFGTGNRMQDFVFVTDVARACVNAIGSDNYGIYNIASGCTVSMKDLALLIKKLTASDSEVKPAGTADPQESYRPAFDISKARRLLDWEPRYTLEKGLREMIDHLSPVES